MAQTYTKMWEAFFGGEFTGGSTTLGPGSTAEDYRTQTQKFYEELIGPAFLGEEHAEKFGASSLEGWYASFDPLKLQQAEETFRSAIGDPYIPGQDPFAWEKVSRYDTTGGDESRIQQLLESELYGQGKFLGGETGAEYGLETSRTLEDYTTGMRGEREELTYGALTSGVGLASGTSGATLRSGEAPGVAEDVLIEAYKKAKTLGSEYRAGKEGVETALEEDLNEALGTYLKTIDEEKEDWFQDVMRNVQTFDKLRTGEVGVDLSEEQIAAKLTHLQDYEYGDALGSQEWGCGYGQEWDPTITDAEGNVVGGCSDTAAYTRERWGDIDYGPADEEAAKPPTEDLLEGYKFRESTACGIGKIWKDNGDGTGECVVRQDLDLGEDEYGFLCAPDNPGLLNCGECNKEMTTCDDGSQVCDPGTCLDTDECGVYGGDGSTCEDCLGVPNGSAIEDDCGECNGNNASMDECGVCGGDGLSCADCHGTPNGDAVEDECGVCGGDGSSCAKAVCWDGSEVDDISQCPPQSCVETGCLQYGPQYVCNEDTGYCQDPSKFKPGKGPKPYTEDVIVDCPDGMWFDGSDCVTIPKDELEDGDECPGGMIYCGGHCICFPGEICSQGNCVSENVEPWPDPPDPPGPGPKRPSGFRPGMK